MENQRKTYIINSKFQYLMIGFALLQSAVTIGILAALGYQFFHKFQVLGAQANIPENHIYFQFLNEQQLYFWKAIAIVFVVVTVFLVASVTILSHRVSGPLYRLTQHMKGISEGKPLTEVQFRDGDFFPELAQTFNDMSQKINDSPVKNKTADE